MISVKYTLKDLEAKIAIKQAARRLSEPEKALKECGLVLLRSIAKNFKAGGRPVRWQKSGRALREGGKTLVDTARLKSSMTMRVLKRTLTVGTNVKYARIHQLGGKLDKNVTIRQHYRYITKAFGRPVKGRKVLVKQHQRQQDMYIPARPFLMVQSQDMRVMKRIVAEYITEGK